MRPVLISIFLLLLPTGCEVFNPLNNSSDVVLSIKLPSKDLAGGEPASLGKVLAITRVILKVTASDMEDITATLDVAGSTASGTVEVPKGTGRKFSVECFDASGNLQYSGETTADIDDVAIQVSITTKGHYPTGSLLSVDSFTFSEVVLSWSKNNDPDFSSYELVRAASANGLGSSSSRTRLAIYSSRDIQSYVDSTVSQNTAYFYGVIVWDTEKLGWLSTPILVITPRFMSSTIGPIDIPDLGSNGIYFLDNSFAPSDAVVTSFIYTIRVDDAGNPDTFWTSDYEIYLSTSESAGLVADVLVWDNLGGKTDGGDDDDTADDSDIFLFRRVTFEFNGEPANQFWGVYVFDEVGGDTGVLDFIRLEIYYSAGSVQKRLAPSRGRIVITARSDGGTVIRSFSEVNTGPTAGMAIARAQVSYPVTGESHYPPKK